ncbi:MAG: hypothetical protein AB7D36_05550 [Oscillospiraceae bacterium]
MSAPNFRTMENFPLYLKDDSEFYTRICPECGCMNSTDTEICEGCNADLDEPSFDECECRNFYDNVEAALKDVNSRLKFHKIEVLSGYYTGAQLFVEKSEDAQRAYYDNPEELDNDDCRYYFDMCRSQMIRAWEAEQHKVCRELAKIAATWGFEHYYCGGIFSNGEAVYYKADTIKAAARAIA